MLGMSSDASAIDATSQVDVEVGRVASLLGTTIREERRRRGMTLSDVAQRAQVAVASVHRVEAGAHGSLEMYVRLADALDKVLDVDLVRKAAGTDTSSEADEPATAGLFVRTDGTDIVHAAMGEQEATVIGAHGVRVGVDEPWQHYRFSGRADVIGWHVRQRALLHIENKTRIPDVQDAIGRFNSTRTYLAGAVWERLAMDGPPLVETHVLVALWSSEMVDVLRRHPGTFSAAFPSSPDAFHEWWSGGVPRRGVTTSLVLLDPFAAGADPRFASLEEALRGLRARVSGYAAAAEQVRRGRGTAR